MSIADMKRAIEAFEEDGAVQERCIGSSKFPWYTTRKPAWNFVAYEYLPIPKPREWWVNRYDREATKLLHNSKEEADEKQLPGRIECVHVREVLEDE